MTKNDSSSQSLQDNIADAELGQVTGGGKATTTKGTKTTTTTIRPMVITMEQVLISSYQ